MTCKCGYPMTKVEEEDLGKCVECCQYDETTENVPEVINDLQT